MQIRNELKSDLEPKKKYKKSLFEKNKIKLNTILEQVIRIQKGDGNKICYTWKKKRSQNRELLKIPQVLNMNTLAFMNVMMFSAVVK